MQDLATKPEEGPTQPRLKVYPKLQSGSQTRSFQYEWYKRYEWLEYSVTNDRVYCFPCRLFGGSVGHKEVTFTNDGFRVWKKMHEKALKHGESTYHINAMQKWINFKSSQQHGNIHQKLDSQHKQQVLDNRDYVKTLLNIVITAAKSNMAFRGHDESENSLNKGIFLEIFDLLKRESEKFQKLVKKIPNNAKYTSGVSQNSLLQAVAECVSDIIAKEAISAPFFAVIADETRDVSVTEQLSVCIRYVLDETVHERFLGFIALKELDADSLATVLLEKLRELGLNVNKLIAQCYDTTSVMSGSIRGVQALIRESAKNPCYYVPCSAHRLQLVITHTAGCLPEVAEFFNFISALINFIRSSTLRHDIFIDIQRDKKLPVVELPKVCQHKWEYNHKALRAIFQRYGILTETLEDLSVHGRSGDEKALAFGLQQSLNKFETVFLLINFIEVFDITTPLSKVWQSEDMDLAAAVNMSQETIKILNERRTSDDHFNAIWEKAVEFATARHITVTQQEPSSSKRQRKPSSRLLGSIVTETIGQRDTSERDKDPKSHCKRCIYYPILDKVLVEFGHRFDEPKHILLGVSACHPSSPNFLNENDLKYLADQYEIESENLHAEVLVAQRTLHDAKSISNALDKLKPLKQGFSTLWNLLHLALTFPVSNAKCERSFSVLKLVKTYIRATMGQKRLTSLGTISIEKGVVDSLDLDVVVDKFASLPIQSQSNLGKSTIRRMSLTHT